MTLGYYLNYSDSFYVNKLKISFFELEHKIKLFKTPKDNVLFDSFFSNVQQYSSYRLINIQFCMKTMVT